jgi:hypothetical protein
MDPDDETIADQIIDSILSGEMEDENDGPEDDPAAPIPF